MSFQNNCHFSPPKNGSISFWRERCFVVTIIDPYGQYFDFNGKYKSNHDFVMKYLHKIHNYSAYCTCQNMVIHTVLILLNGWSIKIYCYAIILPLPAFLPTGTVDAHSVHLCICYIYVCSSVCLFVHGAIQSKKKIQKSQSTEDRRMKPTLNKKYQYCSQHSVAPLIHTWMPNVWVKCQMR